MEEGNLPADMGGMEGTDTDTNSVRSWSAAAKQIRDGFSCCSDKFVHKILQMLKEAVINTLTARSKEAASDTGTEKLFLTSVTKEDLHARLSRLQQRLTDASWRLDVVTYPKDTPMSLNSAYAEDLARPSFLTRKLEAKKASRLVELSCVDFFK